MTLPTQRFEHIFLEFDLLRPQSHAGALSRDKESALLPDSEGRTCQDVGVKSQVSPAHTLPPAGCGSHSFDLS